MGLNDFSAVEQHVGTGTLRLLAAIGATRSASAPDVATVAEQGVRGYAIEAWYGLLAPAGTPPDVIARISGAIDEIRRTAAFRRRLAELSYEPVIDTPVQFEAVIRSDIARYAEIIKSAGIDSRRSPQGATQ
jgi:tripartite-type tricarboxylate transporter receptor subunit TctC